MKSNFMPAVSNDKNSVFIVCVFFISFFQKFISTVFMKILACNEFKKMKIRTDLLYRETETLLSLHQ